MRFQPLCRRVVRIAQIITEAADAAVEQYVVPEQYASPLPTFRNIEHCSVYR